MPEFFNVIEPKKAFDLLMRHIDMKLESEVVRTCRSLGRITAKSHISPENLPTSPRSAMDGFSVRAANTFGASESLPAYLNIVGEVPMGETPKIRLSEGQAAITYTGGMLAENADSVVMIEHTQAIDSNTIEVSRPIAPGENVIQMGEDIRSGDIILPAGHVIRPQDIGGLLALGITQITAIRQPRICIVSTGDELVSPATTPGLGQIRDINTYVISALIESSGGIPIRIGMVKDNYEDQRNAAIEGVSKGDILLFSAGSSLSSRDMTARVFNSISEPGVIVHGLSHKPGKPTIVAILDGKPAFGLPGNPVSAATVFDLLVRPTMFAITQCTRPVERLSVRATLTRDIPSVTGREDHIQIRIVENKGELSAEPVFGKSNLIYTLVRADGSLVVPIDKSGLYAGEEVLVRCY